VRSTTLAQPAMPLRQGVAAGTVSKVISLDGSEGKEETGWQDSILHGCQLMVVTEF
jgi:hypothetical protein